MKRRFGIALALTLVVGGVARAAVPEGDTMKVEDQLKKLAPVSIAVDSGLLNGRQQKLVAELVQASRVMDEIFLRQVSEKNVELQQQLKKAGKKDAALYKYFLINFGPWDRLDHDKPFIDGVGPKSPGVTFYPEDMTKEEFADWIKKHPEDRKAFESNFTVIRRDGDRLVAVPYSEEYEALLSKAAGHLRRATNYTNNASLKAFLKSRADAFLSNDYYQSDVDWVRLKDHDIEVVLGPYEVYEDNVFGYKAAFESFVTRVDPKESRRLSKVVEYLDALEQNLPIADKYKGIGRSLSSPIVVVQQIYSAGDTKAGIQTIAFNLPNDERVRKQEGSKKVMLKNVLKAKFDKILTPIARNVLNPQDVADVDFEAFFAQTLLHEVSHGIGPGEIKKGGRNTTVNRELKDLYSVVEETKADTLGAYNNVYLIEKGLYPKGFEQVIWPTYLAGMFRSVRFGIDEAHGGANAIQFSYILEKGGFTYDPKTKRFSVDRKKIDEAVRDLAHDILTIEAKGDYNAAKKFVKKYRTLPLSMQEALARMNDVPVDIRPVYAYK